VRARGEDAIIGFVSNLVRSKGTEEYVATLAALVAGGVPVRGMMIGGALSGQEEHERELRDLIQRAGLDRKIEMLGYRHDVAEAMAHFDVLLFPSHSEAAPIVVLQALQQGLPIVATDVGNVAEVTDGLAVPVVPVGDVGAMVKGVKDLLALTLEQRRTFRENARIRVDSTFSLETIVARHLQCYAYVLAGTGTVRCADRHATGERAYPPVRTTE
jgi:glycosyltransferase involved in cell wall biosynthesis